MVYKIYIQHGINKNNGIQSIIYNFHLFMCSEDCFSWPVVHFLPRLSLPMTSLSVHYVVTHLINLVPGLLDSLFKCRKLSLAAFSIHLPGMQVA